MSGSEQQAPELRAYPGLPSPLLLVAAPQPPSGANACHVLHASSHFAFSHHIQPLSQPVAVRLKPIDRGLLLQQYADSLLGPLAFLPTAARSECHHAWRHVVSCLLQ
jgi:hypothetical protein